MGIDNLGIDIMGVDILGIDIPAPTRSNATYVDGKGVTMLTCAAMGLISFT